jgi:hypothetical protein
MQSMKNSTYTVNVTPSKMTYRYYNFKTKFFVLIGVISVLWLIIAYFVMVRTLTSKEKEYQDYIKSVEHSCNEALSDAQYIINSLANLLSKEPFIISNNYINNLIHSFNPADHMYREISGIMLDLILIDNYGSIIANSSLPDLSSANVFKKNFSLCLSESNFEFFKLNISPIRKAEYNYKTTQNIIPINMSFANFNKERMGIICSGLEVQKFSDHLYKVHGGQKGVTNIKVVNQANINKYNNMKELFYFKNMINALVDSKNITVYVGLSEYPFMLEVEINPKYFRSVFSNEIIFYFSYLIVFFIFAYHFICISKNSTKEPMYIAYKKLHILTKALGKIPLGILQEPDIEDLQEFSPRKFCKDVDHLMNHVYMLKFNEHKRYPKISADIKKKLLAVILKEEFLPFDRICINDEENTNFYLYKLESLISEQGSNLLLLDSLSKSADYCSKFFPELGEIKVEVTSLEHKSFFLKQDILFETIFHIFSFIVRGKLDSSNTSFVLKADFIDNASLPNIIVEAHSYVGMPIAFNWMSGPIHIYTGLLPVYILAKRNQYFFNINQIEEKVFFSLEPINEEKIGRVF